MPSSGQRSSDHYRSSGAAEDKETLFTYLDKLVDEGVLTEWFEGSHGVRDQTYPDETAEYKEMWVVTYKLWEAQSDLALAALRHDSGDSLSKPLPYHWQRSAHLLANRLILSIFDEVYLHVNEARGYLDLATRGYPGVATLTQIQGRIGIDLKRYLTKSVARKVEEDFGRR